MSRYIFCQRYRKVKTQSQITVTLCKTVNLLFGLSPALGEQDFSRLDHRGIKRRETVNGIGIPEHCNHALHFHLVCRKQLHKTGKRTRCYFCHFSFPLSQVLVLGL